MSKNLLACGLIVANCGLELTLLQAPQETLTSKNVFHTEKAKMWVKVADMHMRQLHLLDMYQR